MMEFPNIIRREKLLKRIKMDLALEFPFINVENLNEESAEHFIDSMLLKYYTKLEQFEEDDISLGQFLQYTGRILSSTPYNYRPIKKKSILDFIRKRSGFNCSLLRLYIVENYKPFLYIMNGISADDIKKSKMFQMKIRKDHELSIEEQDYVIKYLFDNLQKHILFKYFEVDYSSLSFKRDEYRYLMCRSKLSKSDIQFQIGFMDMSNTLRLHNNFIPETGILINVNNYDYDFGFALPDKMIFNDNANHKKWFDDICDDITFFIHFIWCIIPVLLQKYDYIEDIIDYMKEKEKNGEK